MIGRREFLAGAISTVAASRLWAARSESQPSGLVVDGGIYADFGPGEKWLQVNPDIAVDSSRFGDGFRSLRMTSADGRLARAECALGAPPAKLLQADIYVENPANCAEIDLLLVNAAGTGAIAKINRQPLLQTGWNRLMFSVNDCSLQGTGLTLDDWNHTAKLRLNFLSKPGTQATIWFAPIQWVRTRAAITFTFDDGRSGCHDHAMPIMATYGWGSTLYAVTEAVDRKKFDFSGGGTLLDPMTLDQLKGLQDAGWDVASHCATHPDMTKLTAEQKRIELETSKQWLLKNGFDTGARFFATPYGKRDPETQELASRLYENLRDASASPTLGFETPLNLNGLASTRYSLRFQELPSEGRATMRQFQSWVDTAIAGGTWLIIVGHTVDKPDGWLDPNLFRRFLKYLDDRRGEIDVLTMSQYWDRRNRDLQDFSKNTGRRLPA